MSVEAPEGTHPVDAAVRADTTSARSSHLSAIIPALNEARNLPEVARRMPTGIDEIVFVDGHSVDSDWPSAQSGGRATSPPRNATARAWSVAFAKDLLRGNRHATRYQEIHESDAPAR